MTVIVIDIEIVIEDAIAIRDCDWHCDCLPSSSHHMGLARNAYNSHGE